MATIKAECPECGAVRLRVRDITVRVCVDDDRQGSYRFRCPECATAVLHDASSAICALLVSVGVDEEVWHLPAELDEAHPGPAFSHDDLLDFHLLLERDDWMNGLVAGDAQSR